jgi:hypothetical protein
MAYNAGGVYSIHLSQRPTSTGEKDTNEKGRQRVELDLGSHPKRTKNGSLTLEGWGEIADIGNVRA